MGYPLVTLVSESSYPNDIEIQTLLPEPIYFYKWGGQAGTALTLNYSFSNASSFVMNDSYAEDFLEYEMDHGPEDNPYEEFEYDDDLDMIEDVHHIDARIHHLLTNSDKSAANSQKSVEILQKLFKEGF